MATLDLQPLSNETIEKMGFNSHDLWFIKIHDEVFGPFETESLKHYAFENGPQFDNATATRMDLEDYQPFWGLAIFQRRKMQGLSSDPHEGPFWLMDLGIITGPFNFKDVDKKIEMGLLGMTDHVSLDEGESWLKIYEIDGFDRRSLSPEELPIAPKDTSFHKAKLALVEKMDHSQGQSNDDLASMVHTANKLASVLKFNIDELTLKSASDTEVSPTLKWFVPTAAALILTVVTAGYIVFSPPEEEAFVADISEVEIKKIKPKRAPEGQMPTANQQRAPASIGYTHPAPRPVVSPVNYESRYPTHLETHNNKDERLETPYDDRDLNDPRARADGDIREEHSLVDQDKRDQDYEQDYSLDAAMNGSEEPIEPVVEEVSDF